METIFYILGMIPIMAELLVLGNPKKYYDAIHKLRETDDKDEKAAIISDMSTGCTLQAFYAVWTFVGLATFQWPIFLFLILFGFAMQKSRLSWRFAKPLYYVDGVLSIAILLFLIINGIHLHYTFW
jgi:hypothetical protein